MLDCPHMLLPSLVTTLPNHSGNVVCPSLLPITAVHHYCPSLPPPTAPLPLRRLLHHCSCGAALPRCVAAVTAVAGGAARRTRLHNRGGDEGACGASHAHSMRSPCACRLQTAGRLCSWCSARNIRHHLLAPCRCALLLCCLHRRVHRLRHLASISSS